ncbi:MULTISPECIES: hypothetical protein [unclassified Shinella]|jgi:hypothetical protein|uniref:hypothetical protein n=1 Tax=unclassified Shinella TaxID=2643062 RepID=UPI000437A080|nr:MULTISPECIES: hypothetical protein [unclassified Shinella]MCA0342800.1 hypothetical protein [Pseudomonadota bacterium]EYR79875.1 hypothetical protein SHLA_1c000530 [Shinella sp. DD12]MCO5149985.1 hypothetical protein [Shinella sp.]MDC7262107.1 hypothetical protein [Shinella sp. HY16]MDC7269002.1 hypothetical protein [Shinella sp. YZ44]
MPLKTLPTQTGNSCAAHCTAITIMELTGSTITQKDAESTIWNKILFKDDGSKAIKALVAKKNSDPRRILKYVEKNYATNLSAVIKFDDTEKANALAYLPDNDVKRGLEGLYNLIKGQSQTETLLPADDVYYNCSYMMMDGGDPSSSGLDGLHNILVTSSGGQVYYYNSNETKPVWTMNNHGWKRLDKANSGKHSYVFTGLCVAVRKK